MKPQHIAAFACLVSIAAFTPAGAQTTAPAGPPTANPTATATTETGQQSVRELRATCRTEAKGQGLTGDAMHKAVSACVVRARPDLAGQEQCRTEGRTQGLHKEGLRTFVKDCAKTKG